MNNHFLVVVLGDTLLIDGIGACFQTLQALRVIQVDTTSPDIVERIKTMQPQLVIFELDTPRPAVVLSLLREQPGILMVGTDINCSQAVFFNNRHYPIRNLQEFCQLAQAEAGL